MEKVKHVDEDSFVSPVVITVKNDKSVKIAQDSRKLNDSCIKIRPHMSNMEELLNQISEEITRDRTKELMMSKIDLDYAHGQMKPSKETSDNVYLQKREENLADITDLKRDFTVWPTSQQNSKKKLTEHWNTPHQHGSTT